MSNDSNDNANFLLALLIILIFFVLLMGNETSGSTKITNSIQVEASSSSSSSSSSSFRVQPSDHPVVQENSVPTNGGDVSCPMVLSRERLEKCLRGEVY